MRHAFVIAFAASYLQLAGAALAASFYPLGGLPGGQGSTVYNISGDGLVVVGRAGIPGGSEAFRWTAEEGMVGLGDLPGGLVYGEAEAVSYDGSVVVGIGADSEGYQGVRWTIDGTTIQTEILAKGYALDVCDDGSVVVGQQPGVKPAYRWTAEQGLVELPDLPTGQMFSWPSAISPDGSIIVGLSSSLPGDPENRQAVCWTAEEGSVGLGDLPGGEAYSWAYDVSADGSVIVGRANSEQGQEPFRWTAETEMVGLGNLPGDDYWGLAWTVSRDGSVILGYCGTQPGYYEAFIWDEIHQMRNLKDVFQTDYGLDLSDWRLTDARGISADGLRIAGTGVNPDGISEAWLFVIPEPSTLLLLSMGAVGLLAYAWRKRRR